MTSRTLVELTGELLGVPSRVEERSKQGLDAGPGSSVLPAWPSASTAISLGIETGETEGTWDAGGSALSYHSASASVTLATP
jgi:hypothetical protein